MIALDITTFFGRLHPLLVHLPIGFIILALIFELKWFRDKGSRFNFLSITWLLAFISSFFSAFIGWLLARNGHYIESELTLHQYTGILLVLFSCVGWILRIKNLNLPSLFSRINNFIVLILLILVGHFGGSLTHGPNYLIEYAPDFIKSKFDKQKEYKTFDALPLDSVFVFNDLIQPLLTEKCMGCHNTETSYGSLNMTSIEGLKKGGGSGAAIVGKNLNKSLLYKRLTFSQENEKFMPPTGVPFSYHEIQLLQWWIMEGANYSKTLSQHTITPEIQSLLLKNYSLDTRDKPWVEKVTLAPLEDSVFSALENANFSWRTLSQDNPLLDIRFQGDKVTNEALKVLVRCAPYITWLNLGDSKLEGAQIEIMGKMENLTRLNLQKNRIKASDLTSLSTLKHLEVLNLHSTQVNKEVFELIKNIPSLKKVFLWNTKVRLGDISKNRAEFPTTELVFDL